MPIKTTYTCDLCGEGASKEEVRKLGLVPIREKKVLGITLAPVVVCSACRARPVTDLLAVLKPRESQARKALREKLRTRQTGVRHPNPEADAGRAVRDHSCSPREARSPAARATEPVMSSILD